MIKDYVAFDLETTGLNVETDQIIEIGALKVVEGKVCERFIEFLKPESPITPLITSITGITNEMVSCARDTKTIIGEFVDFCGDSVLIGHNIMFDYKFMRKYTTKYGFSFEKFGIDTLKIARKTHKELESKSLGTLCAYYQITNQAAHRAYHDALATAKLYHMLAHDFEDLDAQLFVPEVLHCRQMKVQPCTKRQLEYLKALCTYHNLTMEDNVSAKSRSEVSKIIDHIIATHGLIRLE